MEKLNATAFEEIVEDDGETCLVLFSRKTCTVCQSLHVKLDSLEADYPDFPFYQIDVEETPNLMGKFHLKGVPQTLFFKDGEVEKRITGDCSEDDLADQIEALQ